MLKKLLIAAIVLAAAFVLAVSLFEKKAPDLLRSGIQRALKKDVRVKTITYHFPLTFELDGFEVLERAPFPGEPVFRADGIRLVISPVTLAKKALVIDRVEVSDAEIVIRKYKDKLTHALSDAVSAETTAPASVAAGTVERPGIPLKIGVFRLHNGRFRYVDYDVQEGGFVIGLEGIEASVRDLRMPLSDADTSYSVKARMPQGRDEKPADVAISGWTQFSTLETDVRLTLDRVHLPYFRPYYSQVTPAAISEGYLTNRTRARIHDRVLEANAAFELSQLHFEAYEPGEALFGLRADELLGFLKDSSGRLQFQFDFKWDLKDRSVKLKDVLRKSIEKSLKTTILRSAGDVIAKVLQKSLESAGDDSKAETLEKKLNRVKEEFLKF